MKPFRWNLKKPEQLGSLIKGEKNSAYYGYTEDLLDCSAKIIARSSNRRVVFVGRSPENIFDYLSGVFAGTSHESSIDILNISNRFKSISSKSRGRSQMALSKEFNL